MPDEIFMGICDYCKLEKEVIDISDDPIHTHKNTPNGPIHTDVYIICRECMTNYLNKLRRFIGKKELDY